MENEETWQKQNQEEEITLIDILRVIWKWKWFVIVGTMIATFAAGAVCLYMPKIYRVDMVLQPGILRIKEGGKNVYLDSVKNIKSLIEWGKFNNDIMESIRKSNSDNIPKSLKFKVTMPKGTDYLKVSYETSNIGLGKNILNHLNRHLMVKYSELVDYYKKDYNKKIETIKGQFVLLDIERKMSKENVRFVQKGISELESEIKTININISSLIKQRDEFLVSTGNENKALLAFNISNIIKNNFELINDKKRQIIDYLIIIRKYELRIEKKNKKIQKLLDKINEIEFEKNNIQNINIIKSPTSSTFPVKPRTKSVVLLATVVGLFIMLFLSFFIEYIRNTLRNKKMPKKLSQ